MAVEELREVRNFQENLENQNVLPAREIVQKLNDNEHPFANNEFFATNPAALAADEFKRCVELYNRRCPNGGNPMEAMMLMQEIMIMEDPDKEILQEIAIDLVTEMYNVPDSIDLRAMLEQKDSEEECSDGSCGEPDDEENISDERKAELMPFIEKRRILNSIVHGCAVHQWTSAYYLVQDRLNEINPELIEKYNKIAALVNYWNWQMYFEPIFAMGQKPMLQGINKVNVEEKKIEAYGINFPVLIHELSKGIIDYITTAGVPNQKDNGVTPQELKYIYQVADNYAHEQWHYFFGPTLWRALLNTADCGSDELIPVIRKMSEMSYDDLYNFCINIVFYPEELGKKEMEELRK
jgi:hypothetical protein